ncbi:multicopper oxidase LPR2-like [Argentina anserina]|uniref:multicopper oxidase LPR2-like n=1 Tax=Argentina anserina TaxID=57926 RepID=UPI0021765055|nr:multicopper oxidase LPR2-like [Potentilla anserina]
MVNMQKILVFSALLVLGVFMDSSRAEEQLVNLTRLQMFVDELPDMPRIQGFEVVNGVPKPRSFKVGMYKKKWKFHRDIPESTVYAYGKSKRAATVPGPTIEALHGISTSIEWQNNIHSTNHILPWDPTIPTAAPSTKKGIPTVVHLHGAIGEPASDGNSNAWFTADFRERGETWSKKTYHYYNQQHPGNLWYHDHAMGLTRVNLLAGLVGAYIIRHPDVEAPLGLPQGKFDRTLVIFDRAFNSDGSIYMNSKGNNPSIHPQWQPEYFGDAIIVNGKAWPKLTVRRRKYRFRIINASNARFFKFFFTNGLRFIHVGADSAYIEKPVASREILLGPSEITDVIVDFSEAKTNNAILANDAAYPYPDGDPVNEANSKVMKFSIRRKKEVDTSRVPAKLIHYPAPDISSALQTRYIAMYEYASDIDEPTHLYLNAKPYDAPATETPKEGTTEIWNVINLTEDNHPLHVHLGLFVVLDQTDLVNVEEFRDCMTKKNDALNCGISKYARGNKTEVPAYEKGWKNVFKMRPGAVTKILLRFAYIHSNASYEFDPTAEPGYVYHCHILDHEDNAMMRPLKIIR